jgi:hypothetical protein
MRRAHAVIRNQESKLAYVVVLEEQLQAARDNIAQQAGVVRCINANYERSKEQFQDLVKRFGDRELEVQVLRSRVADAEDEMRRAHAVIRNQESKLAYIVVLEEQLQTARDNIAQQAGVVRCINANYERSKEQFQDLVKRFGDRESEVQVLRSRVVDAENEMKRAHAVIRNQESQLQHVADLKEQLRAARGIMAWQKAEQERESKRKEERLRECEQLLQHMKLLESKVNASRNQVMELATVNSCMNHDIEKKNMDIALLTEKCNKMEALLSDLQGAVFNQEAEKAHKECQFRLYEEELKCAVDLRGQLNTTKQMLVFIEKEIKTFEVTLGLVAEETEVWRKRYLEVLERLQVLEAQHFPKGKVKFTHDCCNGVVLPATNTAYESTADEKVLVERNTSCYDTGNASAVIQLSRRMNR